MYEPSGEASAKSIRIDSALLDILEEEADAMNLSVNAFIESILTTYVIHHRHLESYPHVIINNDILRMFLEEIDEGRIEEIGRELGRRIPRGYLLMRGIVPTHESVIKVLRENYSQGSSLFELHIHDQGKQKILHCTHRNGIKWSRFLVGYIEEMFRSLLDVDISTEYTDSYVTFTI